VTPHLDHPRFQLGPPQAHQYFQGADIQIAVVEKGFQLRHVTSQETAILTDGIAAHGGTAGGDPLSEERESCRFRRGGVDATVANAFHEAGARVVGGVPLVHLRQHRIGLMHGDHRPFGKGVQFTVGDNRRHLNDHVPLRVQAGHFQIYPDQVPLLLHTLTPCCFPRGRAV
tara:strand:+ start:5661 stop:6173 length:513 start_codon:yes stop_codon:yes gene_type:complete